MHVVHVFKLEIAVARIREENVDLSSNVGGRRTHAQVYTLSI